MIEKYTAYIPATGKIVGAFSVDPVDLAGNTPPGASVLTGVFDEGQENYVVGGVLTPRPTAPYAFDTLTIVSDGVDAATLSSLPNPTTVLIAFDEKLGLAKPSPIIVTDGTFVFTTDTPGIYTFGVDSFPYMPYVAGLEAT